MKAAHRAQTRAPKARLRACGESQALRLKVAEAELKAAREGKLFSPARIRRTLTISRLLAPIVVPLAYRATMAARASLDQRRATIRESGSPARQFPRTARSSLGLASPGSRQ